MQPQIRESYSEMCLQCLQFAIVCIGVKRWLLKVFFISFRGTYKLHVHL